MKKLLCFILTLSVFCSLCCANPEKESNFSGKYVASTSWVASIAELAGLDDVITIAPANLKHPPEYEITPDDMMKVAKAELFMQAGYERMMKTISTAAEVSKDKIIKVKTTNTLWNLENMVNTLSAKAGTQDIAAKRFGSYKEMIENARKRIASSENSKIEVFANTNQAELLEDLGLNVVSTFGGGALTSNQIAEAAEKKYVLVVDNVHNPVADPIKTVSPDSIILTLRNFPDHLGNNALYNVIKEDLEALWSTGLF